MCIVQKGYKNHANQWYVAEVFKNNLQKAYKTQYASDVILVTSDYSCNPLNVKLVVAIVCSAEIE